MDHINIASQAQVPVHVQSKIDDFFGRFKIATLMRRVLPASVLNFNGANGLSYGHPLTARRMADDRRTPHS